MIVLAAVELLPWAVAAALLAVVVPLPRGLAWPQRRYRSGELGRLADANSERRRVAAYQWPLRAALVLLALVLVQPQWLGSEQPVVEQRSELLIAIDLSESMASEDFTLGQRTVDRLTAVKALLRPWLLAQRDEQLALVVFAAQAYVQMPFTADRQLFLQLLEESEIGLAGDKTMIGDAIGLAIALFEGSALAAPGDAAAPITAPLAKRILLLTDGVDSGSIVPPLEAAKVAARSGIEIYPVALGDPALQSDYPLALELLQQLASRSGGELLQARDSEELAAVYNRLDSVAPAQRHQRWQRPRTALYPYLLLLAMGLLWWQAGFGAAAVQRG